jgi:predicted nuclease of predicted toxin-antitoxin system
MKGYFFDENLPNRIPVPTAFPIRTTKDVGPSPSDTAVWEYARANELAIVSKDADFSARIVVQQPPPWVVHLRFGNRSLLQALVKLERMRALDRI